MKKIHLIATGLFLFGGILTSCSGNKTSSETTAAEESEPVATEAPALKENRDPVADVFADPARKSEVATDSTYAETPSGLKYIVMTEGTGKSPKAEDAVTVHYRGKLTNGVVFDSSLTRGEPATFPLSRVIPGWTEGLQLMKEGGKTIFYIPSELAYGPAGAPPTIGPNEDLIFEVELIKVGE